VREGCARVSACARGARGRRKRGEACPMRMPALLRSSCRAAWELVGGTRHRSHRVRGCTARSARWGAPGARRRRRRRSGASRARAPTQAVVGRRPSRPRRPARPIVSGFRRIAANCSLDPDHVDLAQNHRLSQPCRAQRLCESTSRRASRPDTPRPHPRDGARDAELLRARASRVCREGAAARHRARRPRTDLDRDQGAVGRQRRHRR
jgi:hypothetical protein